MRATVARRLRRKTYGKGTHPGPVKYYRGDKSSKDMPRNLHGCVIADQARREYQFAKRMHNENNP